MLTAPVDVVTPTIPVASAPGRSNPLVDDIECKSSTDVVAAVRFVVPFVVHPEMPPNAELLFH